MQPLSDGKVRGIDVSHYQGNINWSLVAKSGVQVVYVKATEGTGYNDPMFHANVAGARAAHLEVGAYHFARPNNPPVTEAAHFVQAIHGADLTLKPVLDLEEPTSGNAITSAALVAWVKEFVSYVRAHTGQDVILYTGVWYINEHGGLRGLSMPLWVSLYGPSVPDAGTWKSWVMWQYSDKGIVPGVVGNVDLNVATSLDAIRLVAPPARQVAPPKVAPQPVASKPVTAQPKPSPMSETYTVVPGDTMWGIAQKFNLALDKLESYNPHITDFSKLSVGDVIHLAMPQVTPTPASHPPAVPVPPVPSMPVPPQNPQSPLNLPMSERRSLFSSLVAYLKKLLGV